MTEPWRLSLAHSARLIRTGALSPLELVTSVVERVRAIDPALNALVSWDPDHVLEAARRATRLPRAERPDSPFFGIPITLKDLIDWRGVPTTASSAATSRAPATEDAGVSARLRSAGAILLGKAHTHEFAYGTTTTQTGNPVDPARSPGGSSGGSAAAVAAGLGPVSLGTDTGGSVRLPAALCGVVGLKPTYGLVGRSGLTQLSWSLDHIGPIARTVEDVALTMNAIVGLDDADPASVRPPTRDFTCDLGRGVAGLRVGVPTDYFFDHCSPGVADAVTGAIDDLQRLGATLQSVDAPYADRMVGVGNEIVAAESPGLVGEAVTSPDLLGALARTSVEAGALRSGVTYLHALRAREVVARAWQDAMRDVDVVVTPTSPRLAPLRSADESVGPVLIQNTYVADITGLPALTVPVRDAAGLPVGLQVIGRPMADAAVLGVGAAYAGGSGGQELSR